MGYLSQFNIPFVGLSLGLHKFEYNIDNQFFECFKNAIIQKGNLEIGVDLLKQETMLILDFTMNGQIEAVCDRCAGEFQLPLSGEAKLIIKLGDEEKELSENMIMISRHTYEINIAQYIHEFVTLLLPQRIVHPENETGHAGCDKKTLKAIDQLSMRTHEADPRWEVLKKLKTK